MQLTVLGCRAGMPANGQASSGYLVDSGTTRVLLDCGPGVAQVLSAVAPAATLDAVVISHLHIDHCYDLLPIGKTLLAPLVRYPGAGADDTPLPEHTPVPLYVPAGAGAVLRQWSTLFPIATIPVLNQAFEVAFDVREYQPGDRFSVGDCEISLYGLRHSAPNCGVRIDAPAGSLAYTGDTGVTDTLTRLAAGVDLLLAEASLERTDHGPHGHLSGGDAGRVAAEAGVGQLVLTHFSSMDPLWLKARGADAAEAFAGPVHVAEPHARFAVRATAAPESGTGTTAGTRAG